MNFVLLQRGGIRIHFLVWNVDQILVQVELVLGLEVFLVSCYILSMSYHILIFPSLSPIFPQPAPKATEGMSASHQRRIGWLRPQKLAEDATAAEENGRKQNIERKEEEGPDARRKYYD